MQAASREEVAQKEEKLAALVSEHEKLMKLLSDLQKSLLDLQTRFDAEVEEAKNEKESLVEELRRAKSEYATLEGEIATLREAKNASTSELVSERSLLEKTVADLQNKIDDLTLESQNNRVQISNLNREVEALQSENESVVAQLDEVSKENEDVLSEKTAQISALEVFLSLKFCTYCSANLRIQTKLEQMEFTSSEAKQRYEEEIKQLATAQENYSTSLDKESQSLVAAEKRIEEVTAELEVCLSCSLLLYT